MTNIKHKIKNNFKKSNTKNLKKSLIKRRKNELVMVYYHREGPVDWDTHLKLYLGGWEAHPSAYILRKEIKNITPKQALIQGIEQWEQTTKLDPTKDGHYFSIMIVKSENIFIGLKTINGEKIKEYLK